MIRGFLAIELPPDLHARLSTIQQDLKKHLEQAVDQARISWVRPTSIHLTLRFFGDMPEESIEPLRIGLERVASRHESLPMPIERIGVFPSRHQPRVLWAGPSESWHQGSESKRLTALHRAIEDFCRASGFAWDTRSFNAHLTLARIKEGERLVGRILESNEMMDRAVSGGALPVERIALMQSEFNPSGSIYRKLWEVGIGDACQSE
ncbi:MAG TPA: RNA 2',3'-cyclic phosphodiesterase [Nitrospira sp.]|nr:RNA 2',3'-cyclic phosphodiesterase [Nitrospira sp.]